MASREAASLPTEELLDRAATFTARYSRNSYSGNMFRRYAEIVGELLTRLGDTPDLRASLRAQLLAELEPVIREEVEARIAREEMHTEYAPVLPGGMIIDAMAVSEPTTPDPRLATARRLVTPWRHDHDALV